MVKHLLSAHRMRTQMEYLDLQQKSGELMHTPEIFFEKVKEDAFREEDDTIKANGFKFEELIEPIRDSTDRFYANYLKNPAHGF